MTSRIRCSLLPFLALAVACSKDTPLAPMPGGVVASRSASASITDAGAGTITAMTRNLYIGADVDAVIQALLTPDPSDDLDALLQAITVVGQTVYPLRAEALADEIARRTHVVEMLHESGWWPVVLRSDRSGHFGNSAAVALDGFEQLDDGRLAFSFEDAIDGARAMLQNGAGGKGGAVAADADEGVPKG